MLCRLSILLIVYLVTFTHHCDGRINEMSSEQLTSLSMEEAAKLSHLISHLLEKEKQTLRQNDLVAWHEDRLNIFIELPLLFLSIPLIKLTSNYLYDLGFHYCKFSYLWFCIGILIGLVHHVLKEMFAW